MATCLGVWSVPREGGEAMCAISGEEYNVWDLQWDPVREELICGQFETEKGLLRLKTSKRSGLVRRITPVRFTPEDADGITDFHYHPVTDQFVLRVVSTHNYLWSSSLSSNSEGFKPFITAYNQILTLSVSPDQSEVLFVGVDVDEGVLVQVHDLKAGTHKPLHPPSGDLGSENHPQVDPTDDRYVIFTGRPKAGSGVLCYWDRNEGRVRSFDELSEGGSVATPNWSADGRYIYYRFIPADRDAPRLLLRIEVERTGVLQRTGVPDTLYSGRGLYNPKPGPDDEYALCQKGQKEEASLVILEFDTGEIRELVKGEIHALSPSHEDVYYQSGRRIYRIFDWREGFNRPLEPELVVDFPQGVSDMGDLAVSDDAIYAVLSYKGPGKLIVFRMP